MTTLSCSDPPLSPVETGNRLSLNLELSWWLANFNDLPSAFSALGLQVCVQRTCGFLRKC